MHALFLLHYLIYRWHNIFGDNMNEIKCPKCGTVFQISETDYESIVKQIRDKEFEKEITLRNEQHQIDKDNAVKLAKADIEKQLK